MNHHFASFMDLSRFASFFSLVAEVIPMPFRMSSKPAFAAFAHVSFYAVQKNLLLRDENATERIPDVS
jgi:hypothetical protein